MNRSFAGPAGRLLRICVSCGEVAAWFFFSADGAYRVYYCDACARMACGRTRDGLQELLPERLGSIIDRAMGPILNDDGAP